MEGQPQVVRLPADDKIEQVDPGIIEHLVGRPAIVLDEILALAEAEEIGIVAAAPNMEERQIAAKGLWAWTKQAMN